MVAVLASVVVWVAGHVTAALVLSNGGEFGLAPTCK